MKPFILIWAFACLVFFYMLFSRVCIFYALVDGHSMEPTYYTGQMVAMHQPWLGSPKVGDVVMIREFNEIGKGDGQIDIKRISSITNNCYYVLGDNTNKGASVDSRFYGLLPRKQILGVAWK